METVRFLSLLPPPSNQRIAATFLPPSTRLQQLALLSTSLKHSPLSRTCSASSTSSDLLGNLQPSSMASKAAVTGGGSHDAATEGQSSSSSMADVYKGELTPLQRHVAFFDRDKDGVIYPSETYRGFRAIGCGVALSAASAVFVNAALGPSTKPENQKTPPFKFPIYVKNIHKGKHGSDSGVYDASGRFVPEKFEEIFKKHSYTKPDALTGKELQEMLQANREPKDFKGWLGGLTEWKVLYSLCKDKDGFLHKDTVRAVYDGSLFERLEQERKAKKESTKKK